jgi:SAM-dependent methyltransferase
MSTWHYGLVSEWWAHFNVDGPEIERYGSFVARGQPALDAGCGSGRLLVPWLLAGFDVDGCDVSPDMVARCRERAAAEGLSPTVWAQPLHELDPPRRYRTIVVCGVFGIATTRQQDREALGRLHAALEPGGTLLLDSEMPYANPQTLRRWTSEGRAELPTPWSTDPARAVAPDGGEYALYNRMLASDPLDQSFVLGIRAEKRRDGELVAAEERTLTERMYFRGEMVMLLESAGFGLVQVEGTVPGREATPDDRFLVYVARA